MVFLVHGYNVDAQDAFNTHKELEDNIGSALRAAGISKPVFVTFSWPAQGSFFNYLEDDQDARRAALDLITSGLALFAAFTEPGCRIKTHVMAHSMGALVVREALRASVGHTPTREAAWSITNLIFYGADISRGSLNRKEGRRLLEKSQTFTNYFSRDDAALQTSNAKRALFSPRLGAVGAPDDVTPLMSDIDMTDHWLSIKDTNDDRLFADIPFSHTFYRSDPVFARDVAMVIR
ncbi:MAG: alpha/beta fold hydrolase, partial [Pseudomonadota bacterium]